MTRSTSGRQLARLHRAVAVQEAFDAVGLEALAPAEQAGPAATDARADLLDGATFGPKPEGAAMSTHDARTSIGQWIHRRPAALSGDEQEPRAFLVVIAAREPAGIRLACERGADARQPSGLVGAPCPGIR